MNSIASFTHLTRPHTRAGVRSDRCLPLRYSTLTAQYSLFTNYRTVRYTLILVTLGLASSRLSNDVYGLLDGRQLLYSSKIC